MSSVRKRGKTWTAQVRITGWRSFTKTFNKKSDAIFWSKTLKDKLKTVSLPSIDTLVKVYLAINFIVLKCMTQL